MCLSRHHDVLLLPFRDSSEEDWQDPETSVHKRKQKMTYMTEKSSNRHAEDAEAGLLPYDETVNVKRKRLDSELSYSYQYDAGDEDDAAETPVVTQPPFRNVEAQHTYEPASTEEAETDNESNDSHNCTIKTTTTLSLTLT
jgi:hypothetical protein